MNHPLFMHVVPYSLDGNLSDGYNAAIQSVAPYIEWVLITDADVMLLTPQYGHLITEVIGKNSQAGLITSVTNRIGAHSQRAKEIPEQASDLLELRRGAVLRAEQYGASTSEINPPCSGFLMLFRRAVWQRVGGFKGKGLFGVDWRFSYEVAALGLPILRMDGVLAVHFYRLDGTSASLSK